MEDIKPPVLPTPVCGLELRRSCRTSALAYKPGFYRRLAGLGKDAKKGGPKRASTTSSTKNDLCHILSTAEKSAPIEPLSDLEDSKVDVPAPIEPSSDSEDSSDDDVPEPAPIKPLSDSSDDDVLEPEDAIKSGRDDEEMRKAWARKQKPPRLQPATTRLSKVDWRTNIQPRKTGKALIRHKQRRFVASEVAKILHNLPDDEKLSIRRKKFFDLGERISKEYNLNVDHMCPFWSPMVEDYYGIRMEDFPSIGPFQLTGYEYEEFMDADLADF